MTFILTRTGFMRFPAEAFGSRFGDTTHYSIVKAGLRELF